MPYSLSCPEIIGGPFESGFGNVEAGVGALSGSFVGITWYVVWCFYVILVVSDGAEQWETVEFQNTLRVAISWVLWVFLYRELCCLDSTVLHFNVLFQGCLRVGGCLLEESAGELHWRTQAVRESWLCLLQDVGHYQWCSPRFFLGATTVLHFCGWSSSCCQVWWSFSVCGWFQTLDTRKS